MKITLTSATNAAVTFDVTMSEALEFMRELEKDMKAVADGSISKEYLKTCCSLGEQFGKWLYNEYKSVGSSHQKPDDVPDFVYDPEWGTREHLKIGRCGYLISNLPYALNCANNEDEMHDRAMQYILGNEVRNPENLGHTIKDMRKLFSCILQDCMQCERTLVFACDAHVLKHNIAYGTRLEFCGTTFEPDVITAFVHVCKDIFIAESRVLDNATADEIDHACGDRGYRIRSIEGRKLVPGDVVITDHKDVYVVRKYMS